MAGLRYHPLGPGEIRLLQPLPGGILSFKLIHSNIINGHKFTALSYTWGVQLFPCRVTIDDQSVPITQNLHDGLSAIAKLLRDKALPQGDLFWIDAICINQADVDECNAQVRLMKILYEKAQRIYVWLGRPQNEINNSLAAAKMREFDDRMTRTMKQNRPYRPWWWPVQKAPPNDHANLLLHSSTADKTVFDRPGTPTHNAWLGICALWKFSWWERTWVYQEATVPEDLRAIFVRGVSMTRFQSKVSFISGSSIITWSEFGITMDIADHLASMPGQDTAMLRLASNPLRSIWNLRFLRSQKQSLSLLEILALFRHTQCKDLRDKVYAPLGLAPDSATSSIFPNYRRTILEAYTDVVSYQLQQKGHELDFLGYAIKLNQPLRPLLSDSDWTKWPSWVPQWYEPLAIFPLPKVMHVQKSLEGRAVLPYNRQSTQDHTQYRTRAYSASDNLETVAFIDGLNLHVQVVLCETITELWKPSQIRELSQLWSMDMNSRYWTGQPMVDVLAHTIAADVKYNSRRLVCERNGRVDLMIIDRSPDQLNATEIEIQTNTNTAFSQAMQYRSVCRTAQGSLGLVPVISRPGDKICVLIGSQVLHVLRCRDDVPHDYGIAYWYVGEAYVHGLMDGEVMRRVRNGHLNIEHAVLT